MAPMRRPMKRQSRPMGMQRGIQMHQRMPVHSQSTRRAGPMGRRLAKKALERFGEEMQWRLQRSAESEEQMQRYRRTPDMDLLYGEQLKARNYAEIEEIMEDLQEGRLPEKFQHLQRSISLPQMQELMKLLFIYYSQGMERNSAQWKRLKLIIGTAVSRNRGRAARETIIDIRELHKTPESVHRRAA